MSGELAAVAAGPDSRVRDRERSALTVPSAESSAGSKGVCGLRATGSACYLVEDLRVRASGDEIPY